QRAGNVRPGNAAVRRPEERRMVWLWMIEDLRSRVQRAVLWIAGERPDDEPCLALSEGVEIPETATKVRAEDAARLRMRRPTKSYEEMLHPHEHRSNWVVEGVEKRPILALVARKIQPTIHADIDELGRARHQQNCSHAPADRVSPALAAVLGHV